MAVSVKRVQAQALADLPPAVEAPQNLTPATAPLDPTASTQPVPTTSLNAPITSSTSASKQFIVHGADLTVRGSYCVLAEEISNGLGRLLKDSAKFSLPVVIVLKTPPDVQMVGPAVTTNISQLAHGGFHLQVNVQLRAGYSMEDFTHELVRVLLAERILRSHQELNTSRQRVLPDWLLTGVTQALEFRSRSKPSVLFAAVFRSGQVYSVDRILEADPFQMDSLTRGIYEASSCALILTLLDQPDGPARFGRFLSSLASDAQSDRDLLKQHFPSLSASKNSLEKWWSLQMATLATPTPLETMSVAETERELALALSFDYYEKQRPEAQTVASMPPPLPPMNVPDLTGQQAGQSDLPSLPPIMATESAPPAPQPDASLSMPTAEPSSASETIDSTPPSPVTVIPAPDQKTESSEKETKAEEQEKAKTAASSPAEPKPVAKPKSAPAPVKTPQKSDNEEVKPKEKSTSSPSTKEKKKQDEAAKPAEADKTEKGEEKSDGFRLRDLFRKQSKDVIFPFTKRKTEGEEPGKSEDVKPADDKKEASNKKPKPQETAPAVVKEPPAIKPADNNTKEDEPEVAGDKKPSPFNPLNWFKKGDDEETKTDVTPATATQKPVQNQAARSRSDYDEQNQASVNVLTRVPLTEFTAILKRSDRRDVLQRTLEKLNSLKLRCHPLYRPLIAEYTNVVTQLMTGKPAGITEKLVSLSQQHLQIRNQAAAVESYLDWYEASQSSGYSTNFDDYLKLEQQLEHEKESRTDAISRYLDVLDREYQ